MVKIKPSSKHEFEVCTLAKSFKVEDKGMFPYRFATDENIKNNYCGDIPPFEYFDSITLEQYNEYSKEFLGKTWNLKEETIKYCIQDCVTLYQVLDVFFKENYENTRVIGSKYYSLPSLAFANFRAKFMPDDITIPCLNGEIYQFIKQGYSGGAVDVYKPYGKKIYRYDVNSLYPFIMHSMKLPIGQPTLIEGNIELIENILNNAGLIIFLIIYYFINIM